MPMINLGRSASSPALPMLFLSGAVTHAEGDGGTTGFAFTLTLARNGYGGAVPYGWAVTGSGAAPADATDFVGGVLPAGSGSFAAGETSKTIVVAVNGDSDVEPEEGFTLTATGSMPLAAAAATGAILNDDVVVLPLVTRAVMNPNRPPGNANIGASNGTDTAQMSRKSYVNTSGKTLANLQIGYAGWRMDSSNESNAPAAVTIDGAWLEYPAGTYTPFTFGGSAGGTTTPGATHLFGDILTGLAIADGEQCWLWTRAHVAAGQQWDFSYAANAAIGDKIERGTSLTNIAPTASMAMGSGGMFAPAVIRSTDRGLKPVLALVGDSIEAANDAGDAQGMTTWIGRACTGRMPLLQASISGEQLYVQGASSYPCDAMARRLAWFAACGATHALSCIGTNDINSPTNYATMQTFLGNMWRTLKDVVGPRVYQMTFLPRADQAGFAAADFRSPSTQTVNTSPAGAWTGGAGSVRGQCNAYIRTVPGASLAGYLEAADAVEVNAAGALTRDGGRWIAGSATGSPYLMASGINAGASDDGTHPQTRSNAPEYGGTFILRDAAIPYVTGWAGSGA